MGISIHLCISKSVTKEEWANTYEETLILVRNFPLAEKRQVNIHGIDTLCLVKTEEREYTYGWHNEIKRTGWTAHGDYVSLNFAESYFLPRDLVKDDAFDPDAGDAMICYLPSCLDYDWEDERFQNAYEKWGAKTQGEPYHIYLLAIACLIADRLRDKVYIYGDITRGQCRQAVQIANQYLTDPIDMPDTCCPDRLARRVSALPFSDVERLTVYNSFYLGTKDANFGDCIREHFQEDTLDAYWKRRMSEYDIGTYGFDSRFDAYLVMGFDLQKLCGYVRLQDKDGKDVHAGFVKRVMDARLHIAEKDCGDILKIDKEASGAYGVSTLFAQFGLAGARNRRVDRFIPVEEVRQALKTGLAAYTDVDQLIDEYLEMEAASEKTSPDGVFSSDKNPENVSRQEVSDAFNQIMNQKMESMQKMQEEYDICDFEDLKFYKQGDTIQPELEKSLGKSRRFLDDTLKEEQFTSLMNQDAHARCAWLIEQNRSIALLDKDWDRIFTNIEDHKESFARYYPIMRTKLNSLPLIHMSAALMINDELYAYSKQLADQTEDDSAL